MCNFCTLPFELLAQIILDRLSLFRIARMCKCLATILLSDNFLEVYYYTKFGKPMRKIRCVKPYTAYSIFYLENYCKLRLCHDTLWNVERSGHNVILYELTNRYTRFCTYVKESITQFLLNYKKKLIIECSRDVYTHKVWIQGRWCSIRDCIVRIVEQFGGIIKITAEWEENNIGYKCGNCKKVTKYNSHCKKCGIRMVKTYSVLPRFCIQIEIVYQRCEGPINYLDDYW
jgi:hypothetical protein